jgi:hypothetical protein
VDWRTSEQGRVSAVALAEADRSTATGKLSGFRLLRKTGRAWRAGAASRVGGSNSVVESQPSKLLVAGSIPVSRSNLCSPMDDLGELRLASQVRLVHRSAQREGGLASHSVLHAIRKASKRRPADLSAVARRAKADVAQSAERVLGKDEVTSSILVIGSI